MRPIDGSITAPRGFKAAAVFCDVKRLGTGKGSNRKKKGDLALIVSERPAAVAGMFTTNQVAAAPVKISARRAARDFARAIVVNSGNANACTGERGMRDAREMTRLAARLLRLRDSDVLVGSTGRIGVPMPMANVKRGIRAAAPLLKSDRLSARAVAEAIMTSDTRSKEIAVEFEAGGVAVRIGGCGKGAGMIHPKIAQTLHATMLAFITTDCAIAPVVLKRALAVAVGQSFNCISVDGDMSTNDTVIVLANGAAGNRPVSSLRTRGGAAFQEALNFVTRELAKMIVLDGEGVTRFVTLHVHGARTSAEAEEIARSIANSVLVKTSWCGGDPNWGRILCAIGYSRARIDERRVDIGYAAHGRSRIEYALRAGQPTRTSFAKLVKLVGAKEFEVHIFLHAGKQDAVMYASDLTEKYVEFNKGDVSDPKSLGG